MNSLKIKGCLENIGQPLKNVLNPKTLHEISGNHKADCKQNIDAEAFNISTGEHANRRDKKKDFPNDICTVGSVKFVPKKQYVLNKWEDIAKQRDAQIKQNQVDIENPGSFGGLTVNGFNAKVKNAKAPG